MHARAGGHAAACRPWRGPRTLGGQPRRSNDAHHDINRRADPFHARRRAQAAAAASVSLRLAFLGVLLVVLVAMVRLGDRPAR